MVKYYATERANGFGGTEIVLRRTRKTSTKPMHKAVCLCCYTAILATGTKKACERAATAHMSAYGHQTTILEGSL